MANDSETKSDNSPDTQGEEIRYVNLYDSGKKIHIRKITGFYQNIRRYTGLPLIAAYLLLPWLMLDGRPAILFDLPARQFHVFWMTFWPQDFMLLAWLLIIAAFALFTVTVLLGRVWCGFTCPQTVWTLMFISIERLCEGDRNKRIKLDAQDWNVEKIIRRSCKHFLWGLLAFITGVTFVGYFVPIRELLTGLMPYYEASGMLVIDAHPAAAFWTLFFTGMTYLNAGWLREQVCLYMCPYARFQSAMYDNNTLAVYYDAGRGESRGPRKPGDDYQQKGLGDCIDCSWCVQVCPVDIDIRDGMQYDCINCGLCVDACNTVMDKMKYHRGLIRFTSEEALKTGSLNFLRPRLFGYSALVAAMLGVFIYFVGSRTPLIIDVVRDRGEKLYRANGGEIQNVYTLKFNNMDTVAHRYSIKLIADVPLKIKNYRAVEIESGEVYSLPIRIAANKEDWSGSKKDVQFYVEAIDNSEISATETSTFFGPSEDE